MSSLNIWREIKIVWKDVKTLTIEDEKAITSQAKEVKSSPLFSNAKTRESKDVNQAENCKQTITKEEKRKISFTQFDAPRGE